MRRARSRARLNCAKGRFELADGGTLFLDEVGNTSQEMQAKFCACETMEFERVGGQKPIKVNVRLIAATNANLEGDMREGTFRRTSIIG